MSASVWKPGDVAFVAHPDEVERVTIIEAGDGGRLFRRPVHAPYVVRGTHEEFVVSGTSLFANELAAAAASAEKGRGR